MPAKLAATWFASNERVTAITFAVAAQAVGAAIGFLIPTIWIQEDDTQELFKEHILVGLYLQAAVGIALTVIVLIFFKNKPKIPPSLNAL